MKMSRVLDNKVRLVERGLPEGKTKVDLQQQFLNAYIFSAACPAKDKVVGFISPVRNKGVMQIHLDMISQSAEGHEVILLDDAGWHSANSLIIPQNITLMKLPPYSPELNLKKNF